MHFCSSPSTLRLKFLMNLEKFSKLSLSEKKRSFISFWLSFFKNLREKNAQSKSTFRLYKLA